MNKPVSPERYKKVLVIDDDKIDMFISKRILQSVFFAEEIVLKNSIVAAADYLENSIRTSKNLPEIIFLDLNMPGEDSYDFIEQLTELKAVIGANFRVMILASETGEFKNKRATETDYSLVEAVFEKPLKPDVLTDI